MADTLRRGRMALTDMSASEPSERLRGDVDGVVPRVYPGVGPRCRMPAGCEALDCELALGLSALEPFAVGRAMAPSAVMSSALVVSKAHR